MAAGEHGAALAGPLVQVAAVPDAARGTVVGPGCHGRACGGVNERVLIAESYDRLAHRGKTRAELRLVARPSETYKAVVSEPNAPPGVLLPAAMQADAPATSPRRKPYTAEWSCQSRRRSFAHNNLAMLLAARGGDGLDEAVASADAAVKLQPRQAAVYDTLAFVQSKSGDARAAAASMRTAADLELDECEVAHSAGAVPVRQRRMGGGGRVIDTIDRAALT